MYQRPGDGFVVGAVLPGGPGRDRDRDRARDFDAAQHGADEARDAPVASETDLVLVGALAEEAAGLEQEAVEDPRMPDVRVQHGERTEARAHPDAHSVRRVLADLGQQL